MNTMLVVLVNWNYSLRFIRRARSYSCWWM